MNPGYAPDIPEMAKGKREDSEEGGGGGGLQRLSLRWCPSTARLCLSRARHGACSRTIDRVRMNEAPLHLGRGQNAGHLHPKRRFRRSFLGPRRRESVMSAACRMTDEPESDRSCKSVKE
ncbi:unnamed protein product [Pleuronectes platessa]|uniref:Uncharacterized protein n=1 Tax=Pleuronectes platessa TaxID=8262 RepID=A0A9N7VIK5_PLEPL|nr:unnamed protein product [Pleuronectes platessa]